MDEITQVYQIAEEYLKSDEARFIRKQLNQSKNNIRFDAEDKNKGKANAFWTSAISFGIDDLPLQDVQSSQMIESDPSPDFFVEDLIKNEQDLAEDLNVYLI